MLRILRKGQRWVTLFFIFALGGGLVLYLGIGGSPQRAQGTVVMVGDESFGQREFGRVRARRESMLQQQLGAEFDPRELSDTLDQLAIQALIDGAVLSREASALGLAVSKREIERAVRGWLVGEDGRFDPQEFNDWVEHEFGTHRSFIREQRSAMLANKLMRAVTSLADPSEGEARQAVIRRLEQVQIAFVKLDASGPAAGIEPDAEALKAFAAGRENELRALYEQRASLYDVPEQVRARHILLSVAADASPEQREAVRLRAEGLLERVRAGADFAELAREHSEDPGSRSEGGDLGFFARGQMVGAFEEAAFAREPGELGELVETEYGFHILQVEEHRAAQQRSFEKVRDELAREMMSQELARTEARARAERLAEAIRNGASLEDAARAEGLTLQRSDRLQRRSDGYIPELGASEAVMAAAFSLAPGASSDRVFEVAGSPVLIQVTARFAPEADAVEAALDAERRSIASQSQQAFLSTWINQARSELAEEGELVVDTAVLRGGR
ncbi:MAG TPA: peptidylprolyl isomerase [Myxococcota bacterium]|nr:peptidylprolyl isomerase [Myxococcota bacterium]